MGDYIIPARFYQDELADLKRDDYWEWVKQVQAHKRQWKLERTIYRHRKDNES